MERIDDVQPPPEGEQKAKPPPTQPGKKVEILPGAEPDGSACTFCIHHEDHTIGNLLRYMLMQDPDVEFCGYSAPHPSEPLIHVRVQMHDGNSAIDAVKKALENMEAMVNAVKEAYAEDLEGGDYEQFDDRHVTMEMVKKLGRKKADNEPDEDVSMS